MSLVQPLAAATADFGVLSQRNLEILTHPLRSAEEPAKHSTFPFGDNYPTATIPTPAPITPRLVPTTTSSYSPPSARSSTENTMDVLAAVFFLVAGIWLIVAIMYTIMVLLFLRMRSRGQLDRIYEEDFGRIYLFGSDRFYLPTGCLMRRYIQHLHNESRGLRNNNGTDSNNDGERARQMRYMTKSERRAAMESLLVTGNPYALPEYPPPPSPKDAVEHCMSDDEAPTCSICLGEYELGDKILPSKTCSHVFHQDCLLGWLQRPDSNECPCCRTSMISEDGVWEEVRKARKLRRRQRKNKKKLASTDDEDDDDDDEDLEPTARDDSEFSETEEEVVVRVVPSETSSNSTTTTQSADTSENTNAPQLELPSGAAPESNVTTTTPAATAASEMNNDNDDDNVHSQP